MGGDICAPARLQYQREPGDRVVLWGTEIPVKMDASRNQKIKVHRVRMITGRKIWAALPWPFGK